MQETLHFLLQYGYAVLFIGVFVEQIGLPIPAIPVLLAMGALAGSGHLNYFLALLVAAFASLIADNIWYWLGFYRGASILNLLCKISLEPDSCVRSTENMFLKYGARGLLFAKFVPGLSTAACPLAGMFRMEVWKFCLFDGLGALIWAGSYSVLGFIFRDQLEYLFQRAEGTGSWIIVAIAVAFAGWILWKFIERRRFYTELRVARITSKEVLEMINAGGEPLVVDMRSERAWDGPEARKLPGALHLGIEGMEEGLRQFSRDRDVILYCT